MLRHFEPGDVKGAPLRATTNEDPPARPAPLPTVGGARRRLSRAALALLLPASLFLAAGLPGAPGAAGTPRRTLPPAPAEAAAPPAAAPLDTHVTGSTHRVGPGQTLSTLALFYGTTVDALTAANGLSDPNLIRVGRTLVIPGPSSAPAASAASGSAPSGPAASAGTSGSSTAGLPARLRASPERLAYRPTFARWAAANGVPLDLLEAMTWMESGWQNGIVSPDGAVGIGQLMPDTVDFMEQLIGVHLDPHVAEDNIRMAARYLRWLLARYGTADDALAAYYQGPASVESRGRYADTEAYVTTIEALRARF